MSMSDPRVPDGKPVDAPLLYNESADTFVIERANQSKVLMASSSISATTAVAFTNHNARGIVAFMTISTAFPASASLTYTLKVKMTDPSSGITVTLAAAPPRSASGTDALVIYPGAIAGSASAGATVTRAGMPVPRDIIVTASMSALVASTNVAMSLGLMSIL